ncbi:protein of unknown function [Taphrina deformans PYCC 5710]|uniref:SURF6-domain-containing protein n=1 Tax=Taphrina deformans (strain PYCC 5710 / ATCC 11124 / CBS 356.35 / IMI 108563 / JCM 9778 / NBRC 8474) TaxID=1097556 RepID=R4XGT1_TAPDE|nr:protein of unknown function [Taphrina deformans PYCC 5710]|eukprot:CCG83697.1 protein of unknown function [Taphrina deformans PYCC 5710]
MSESDLAARLAAHGHAFEGLLDLIPAKFYNPEDASNQWNKRKQTKEEAVQAKKAKLDPDQNRSTLQNGALKMLQKDKVKTEVASKAQSKKRTKQGNKATQASETQDDTISSESKRESAGKDKRKVTKTHESETITQHQESNGKGTSAVDEDQTPNRPDPNRNIADLRAKLAAKIEALRSKRKAPGTGVDGAPKSRDAILEARRIKEEARRAKKKLEKEARKDAAQEIEDEHESEVELSDEDVDDSVEEEEDEDNVVYGKVAFSDGDQLDANGNLLSSRKRKQQDTQSALQAALNKKARLAALPAEKQAKIADSDSWHKALLQADGEKVKDDLSKLKKAAKRQESIKKKSTKEWKERLSTIAKNKALKQKNREQNLKDRRDSKGKSGGHKKGKQIGAYQGKKSTKGKGKSGGF